MARYIMCPHCKEMWQISRITKVLYDQYLCPECCDKEKARTSGNSKRAVSK